MELESKRDALRLIKQIAEKKKGKFKIPDFIKWDRAQIRSVENQLVRLARKQGIQLLGRQKYDFNAHTDIKASPFYKAPEASRL